MSLRMERCRPQCGSSLLMPIVSLRVFIGHHRAHSSLLSLPCTCCTLCLNCPAALQCHLYLARPLGWVRPLAVHPTPARLAGLLLPPLTESGSDQLSALVEFQASEGRLASALLTTVSLGDTVPSLEPASVTI